MISPMYCMTVTSYFLQSFQNCDTENLLLKATVIPTHSNRQKNNWEDTIGNFGLSTNLWSTHKHMSVLQTPMFPKTMIRESYADPSGQRWSQTQGRMRLRGAQFSTVILFQKLCVELDGVEKKRQPVLGLSQCLKCYSAHWRIWIFFGRMQISWARLIRILFF